MNTRNAAVVLLAAASAILAGNNSANAGLELVVKNTDAVPSISGATWATSSPFVQSSIDNSGNVAFRAGLQSGVGGVTTSDNTTAWYGAPGSLSLFARTNNALAGVPGILPTSFNMSNIGLSGNGQLYFSGSTAAPSGYIAIGTAASGFNKVARNGDTLPGVGAATINSNPGQNLAYYYANNAGQTLVGSSVTTSPASSALWVGSAGNLQLAYQTGQSYAGLPTGGTPKGFNASMINGSASLYASFLLNNATGIDQNNNEMLTTLPFGGNTFTPIAREIDAAPGCGGALYQRGLFDPGLGIEFTVFNTQVGNYNNAGHAVYSTGLEGAGVTAGNNSAMFYYDGTSAQLLRRRGDGTTAVPGAVLNFNSASALSARLNNNDSAVIPTSLITGSGGVTTSNDTVLLKMQLGSSSDTLIAREGSNVPVAPGALFGGSFSNVVQNNAGQIVFSTTMTDDLADPNNNVTTSNDLALFAWDPILGLSLVAREGDSLAPIGLNMTLTGSWLSMNTNANVEGGAFALSDTGWLTFRASGTALPGFTDTSAIVRTQVPEPATAGVVAAAGGLLALRRRRRQGSSN
jgi:hypothetical protein